MLRVPLTRAICLTHSSRVLATTSARLQSNTPAKAPEKVEVFIDDQPVMVAPGTTVLQVTILLLHPLDHDKLINNSCNY